LVKERASSAGSREGALKSDSFGADDRPIERLRRRRDERRAGRPSRRKEEMADTDQRKGTDLIRFVKGRV